MQPARKEPERWLVLLLAGIILFVGGGGTGYMLGQQAKSAQTTQMKNGPKNMKGQPSGKPSGMPKQNSNSN